MVTCKIALTVMVITSACVVAHDSFHVDPQDEHMKEHLKEHLDDVANGVELEDIYFGYFNVHDTDKSGMFGFDYTDLFRTVCQDELNAAGVSSSFARNVAHRLHSLSFEDIQMFFKTDLGEENGIPTVNKDLESDTRILENTPRVDLDMKFTTPALRYMDLVLRNMDKDYYSITNFSILEKLAHMYHMAELWQHASTHYSFLLLNPPAREVCTCVSNSQLSTVTQELHLLALKIKYPGITSGEYNEKKGTFNDYGYGIEYSMGRNSTPSTDFQKAVEKFDFTGPESEVVERVITELVDGDTGMDKKLDNEEGWQYWKEKIQAMEEIGNYELAMYMYCKLNA